MADIENHYQTDSTNAIITNNNKHNNKNKNTTTLKLFGINISENYGTAGANNDAATTTTNNNVSVTESNSFQAETRKYECQYCFREFANSQALGGHQNAHKKERQLLKRAQLQASRNLAAASYVPTSMFSTVSSFPPQLLPTGVFPVPHHHQQYPSWFYNNSSNSRPVNIFSGHGHGVNESLGLNARNFPENWNGLTREDGGNDRRDKGRGLDLHLSL